MYLTVKYERRTSRHQVHQENFMDFHVNKKVYMARIKDSRVVSVWLTYVRRYNVAIYKFALKRTAIKRVISDLSLRHVSKNEMLQ